MTSFPVLHYSDPTVETVEEENLQFFCQNTCLGTLLQTGPTAALAQVPVFCNTKMGLATLPALLGIGLATLPALLGIGLATLPALLGIGLATLPAASTVRNCVSLLTAITVRNNI